MIDSEVTVVSDYRTSGPIQAFTLKNLLVTISTTFYLWLFHTKVLCKAFHFRFELFLMQEYSLSTILPQIYILYRVGYRYLDLEAAIQFVFLSKPTCPVVDKIVYNYVNNKIAVQKLFICETINSRK